MHVAGADVGRIETGAVDGGQLNPGRGMGEQVLLQAADEVVGDRLDLDPAAQRVDPARLRAQDALVDQRLLPPRYRVEQAEGGAPVRLPRDLGRAQYSGAVGPLHFVAGLWQVEARRRPSDAPRVEQGRGPADADDAGSGGLEDLDALQEEGPALAVKSLEDPQVEHRRVPLDLAEVRVDGGIEGDVHRQPVAQIQAGGGEQAFAASGSRRQGAPAQGEGEDFQAAPRIRRGVFCGVCDAPSIEPKRRSLSASPIKTHRAG